MKTTQIPNHKPAHHLGNLFSRKQLIKIADSYSTRLQTVGQKGFFNRLLMVFPLIMPSGLTNRMTGKANDKNNV